MTERRQVLVVPFVRSGSEIEFAILLREDLKCWHWVGGAVDPGETDDQAALREAMEELGLTVAAPLFRLDTIASISVGQYPAYASAHPEVYVVHERSYAIELSDKIIALSQEHLDYRWVTASEAHGLVAWDSSRTALDEVVRRIALHDMEAVRV